MTASAGDAIARGLRLRLIALLLALLGGTVLAVGLHAIDAFERAVAPELSKRTRLIGAIVRAELQRALELGVPLDAMAGLDGYLTQTLHSFEEVDRIVVRTSDGAVIASAGRERPASERPTLPVPDAAAAARRDTYTLAILDGNRLVGEVVVELSPAFVRTRLREVLLDVMVIGLAAALLALELTLLLAARAVDHPLARVSRLLEAQREGDFRYRVEPGGPVGLVRAAERLNDHAEDLAARFATLGTATREALQRQWAVRVAAGRPLLLRLSDVGDIRLALFLFVVATEIAVSFLPVYTRALARPAWLEPELAAAAPLVAYLGAVALLTAFGGALVRRFGARRLFALSVPPTVLCLLGLAVADHVAEVTLWRGLMALCYASATIACQEYALRASADQGGARAAGAFVAVVYGGVFCGAALGGVVAGRLGYGAALATGALIAAVAGIVGLLMMRGAAGDAGDLAPAGASHPPAAPTGIRVLALLLGLVVPMSAGTAVVVWYMTPLMLTAAGSGPAEVARVVMLYYLAVVVLGPAVAALSHGAAGLRALAVGGAMLSGLAILALASWAGYWSVVGAVAALGVGHTLMRAPLVVLAQRIDPGGSAVGPMRLAERLGAIAGLAACAFALPAVGAAASLHTLATFALLGLAGYLFVEWLRRARRA